MVKDSLQKKLILKPMNRLDQEKALRRKEELDINNLENLEKALNAIYNSALHELLDAILIRNSEKFGQLVVIKDNVIRPKDELSLATLRKILFDYVFEKARKYSFTIPPMHEPFNSNEGIYKLANRIFYHHQESLDKQKPMHGIWLNPQGIGDVSALLLLYLGTNVGLRPIHRYKKMNQQVISTYFEGIRYVRYLPGDLLPDEKHRRYGVHVPHIHLQNSAGLNVHYPLNTQEIICPVDGRIRIFL